MTDLTISALYIYPVKSLAGVKINDITVTSSGLQGDRQWAIFKADGGMLTQRQAPAMARITPTPRGEGLTLSSPELGEIEVKAPLSSAPIESFNVWKDKCYGQYASEEVNEWLTKALESPVPLKLAKAHPASTREYADNKRFGVKGQHFADAGPYLVANEASIEALNHNLQAQGLEPVDMRHFRPNVVLSGIEAFDEHNYHELHAADNKLSFRLVDHCQRCAIITVDPDSGRFLPKAVPFKSLTGLNSMPDKPKAPAFGINSTLISGEGETIRVGQPFTLRHN